MSWHVQEHSGGSWYVVWKGRRGDCLHDDHSYLAQERAEAICAALNATERAEMKISRQIRDEVRQQQLAAIVERSAARGMA